MSYGLSLAPNAEEGILVERTEEVLAQILALPRHVKNDRKGVTALEYGLLAGLIAVVIIGGATVLGTNVNTLFNAVATTMSNV
jgi:pilus assembly protein Flp/PilA